VKYKGIALGVNPTRAYIYIFVSPSNKIAYIGQTNSAMGVVGRTYQHFLSEGTFRSKVEELGFTLNTLGDLILLCYPLPDERRFISNESAYRLAVEYLVQVKLHKIRHKFKPCFLLISNVTYTSYADYVEIDNIAEEIVQDFFQLYTDLHNTAPVTAAP